MDIIQHFEQRKHELRKRIDANPSRDNALKLVKEYFADLHRDFTKTSNIHKSRQLNALLDVISFSLGAVDAVDETVKVAPVEYQYPQLEQSPEWMLAFGKLLQGSVILSLILLLFQVSPLWIALLLFLILFAGEKYLQALKNSTAPAFLLRGLLFLFRKKTKTSPSLASSGIPEKILPQVDVQLRVESQALLNYLIDSLSVIEKILNEHDEGQEVSLFEKEPQILEFFQEMFEAQYFNDGQWALKKVSGLAALLRKNGIDVKTFDPQCPNDTKHFDFEPSVDSSITDYLTIRPAFVKGEQTLLRGQVAEPFQSGDSLTTNGGR